MLFPASELYTHSSKLSKMTQAQINSAIETALNNLYNLNEQVCNYWLCELYSDYTEDDQMNYKEWNEDTLKKMETDVMYNS